MLLTYIVLIKATSLYFLLLPSLVVSQFVANGSQNGIKQMTVHVEFEEKLIQRLALKEAGLIDRAEHARNARESFEEKQALLQRGSLLFGDGEIIQANIGAGEQVIDPRTPTGFGDPFFRQVNVEQKIELASIMSPHQITEVRARNSGSLQTEIASGWKQIVGFGTLKNANNYRSYFMPLLAVAPNKIIRRQCDSCDKSHQDIYYRRTDQTGVGGMHRKLLQMMMGEDFGFHSSDCGTGDTTCQIYNACGEDFTLHSTYQDAKDNVNPWQACRTIDFGLGDDMHTSTNKMGFPGYSGISEPVYDQYNMGRRSGQPDYAFFVEDTKWIPIYGNRGLLVTGEGVEEKNLADAPATLSASEHMIIRRVCLDCTDPRYRDIYYRRILPVPKDIDIWSMIKGNFQDQKGNIHGYDYELHSTYNDAINAENGWYCGDEAGDGDGDGAGDTPPPDLLMYEAENYSDASNGVEVTTQHEGYNGEGYVAITKGDGSYVEWDNIDGGIGGACTLKFRYANGGNRSQRPAEVTFNGVLVAKLVLFTKTGTWKTYTYEEFDTMCTTGPQTLRLTFNGSRGPSLDSIQVLPRADTPYTPTVPDEGTTIRCTNNSSGTGNDAHRFRYANNQIRKYPNPDIATSWDLGWRDAVPIDCTGIPLGENMEMNEEELPTTLIECQILCCFPIDGEKGGWANPYMRGTCAENGCHYEENDEGRSYCSGEDYYNDCVRDNCASNSPNGARKLLKNKEFEVDNLKNRNRVLGNSNEEVKEIGFPGRCRPSKNDPQDTFEGQWSTGDSELGNAEGVLDYAYYIEGVSVPETGVWMTEDDEMNAFLNPGSSLYHDSQISCKEPVVSIDTDSSDPSMFSTDLKPYVLRGQPDEHAGWYDLQNCGQCSDWCGWFSADNEFDGGMNPHYQSWTPGNDMFACISGSTFYESVRTSAKNPTPFYTSFIPYQLYANGNNFASFLEFFPTIQKCSGPNENSPPGYGFEYLGCYKDGGTRALPHRAANGSLPACITSCRNLGYKYVGRQYAGECWCGGPTHPDYVSYDRYGPTTSNVGSTETSQSGIEHNVLDSEIVDRGWENCYSGSYSLDEEKSLSEIMQQCQGTNIMYGCRNKDSDRWKLLGYGNKDKAFTVSSRACPNDQTYVRHYGCLPRVERNGEDMVFFFKNEKASWNVHEESAIKCGGHLASYLSANEQAIVAAVTGDDEKSWTGLYQPQPCEDEPSGCWTWTDGSSFDFKDWNEGEPNNVGDEGEHCAVLRNKDGWGYNDATCSSTREGVYLLPLNFPSIPDCEYYVEPTETEQSSGEDGTIDGAIKWYFSEDKGGMGFAQSNDEIDLSPCDRSDLFSNDRLCWHVSEDKMENGWRCGDTSWLNFDDSWERAIWTTSTSVSSMTFSPPQCNCVGTNIGAWMNCVYEISDSSPSNDNPNLDNNLVNPTDMSPSQCEIIESFGVPNHQDEFPLNLMPYKYQMPAAEDPYAGYYDVQRCGKCNDFCFWTGPSKDGSGLNPEWQAYTETDYFTCKLAGSYSGPFGMTERGYFGKSFSFQKCEGEGTATPHYNKVEYLGCFHDRPDRALPERIGSGVLTLDACGDACREKGYHYFGRQEVGFCYCGGEAASDKSYAKYGEIEPLTSEFTCSSCDGSDIGYLRQCVFKITDQYDPEVERKKNECSHIPSINVRRYCYVSCRDQNLSYKNLLACQTLKVTGLQYLNNEIAAWKDSPICDTPSCIKHMHPLGNDIRQSKGVH